MNQVSYLKCAVIIKYHGVMVKDTRCNIPAGFVAHRKTQTAREQGKLRPHTLQKQAADMEH